MLPGTSFRQEAEQLGLIYQDRPPYYVLETPTLSTEQMYDLMAEAEDAFETEFDPLPEVELEGSGFGVQSSVCKGGDANACTPCKVGDGIAGALLPSPLAGEGRGVRGVASHWRIDLDEHIDASIPQAANRAQAFTLWFRSSDFSSHRKRAAELIDQLLTANPFTTLQIVLEPTGNRQRLSAQTCESLLRAAFRQPTYLDRFYSVQPGRIKGAKRLIVVLPPDDHAEEPSPKWLAELEEFATIVRWHDASDAVIQSA